LINFQDATFRNQETVMAHWVCGPSLVFCVGASLVFPIQAQSQDLKDIQDEWALQVTGSVGHAPERGAVPLGASKGAPAAVAPGISFNRYLSLLVSDAETAKEITFSAVMSQLAAQTGDPLFTKEMLFHQWWDTQNQQPGLDLGPHCDGTPPQDKAKLFQYDCPRLEGNQSTSENVFSQENAPTGSDIEAYSAIALSNRYDLLSPAQSAGGGKIKFPDCGEYRIIFARNSGKTTPQSLSTDGKLHEGDIFNRNLISFEFRIKNPDSRPENADVGVPSGCLPILRFWYSLSETSSGKIRGQRLHDFFMNGKMTAPDGQAIGQLPSGIVDIRNLSPDAGQIRTNQFLNNVAKKPPTPPHDYTPGTPGSITVTPNNWILREFRTLSVGHKLLIVPDSTKSNPDFSLFKTATVGSPADPRLSFLLNDIKDQAENLLGGGKFDQMADINAIRYLLTKSVTNAEQGVMGSPVPCSPPSACVISSVVDNILGASNGNTNLMTDIQDDVIAIKAPPGINAGNIVDRLRTQTCAGCHQFSDTKQGPVGFDDKDGLGGGAHWPTKACGDYGPSCTLGSFLITDKSKLHPPMQFTQVSEAVLVPAAGDGDGHWRYAISSTVECMLDFREKFMKGALGMPATSANNCPP
jgi:hypothetical protein